MSEFTVYKDQRWIIKSFPSSPAQFDCYTYGIIVISSGLSRFGEVYVGSIIIPAYTSMESFRHFLKPWLESHDSQLSKRVDEVIAAFIDGLNVNPVIKPQGLIRESN